MQRSNIIFLKNQLISFLNDQFQVIDPGEQLFKIEFDAKHEFKIQGTWDYLFFSRVLPDLILKPLTIDTTVDILTTDRNEIPLWIKIDELEKQKLYKLVCSKKFRKRCDIKEWNKANPFPPFFKHNST